MAAFGVQSLLKEGTRHLSGLEESILKNIEACEAISKITRTSLGPNGMNKMVLNRHGKTFVTSDGALILKELEVEHPAAKLIVMHSEMQEREMGDATNLVVVLAGELLSQAAQLLKMGLPPSEVISGYEKAGKLALQVLETLIVGKVEDLRSAESLARAVRTSVASKQYNCYELLARLVAEASLVAMSQSAKNFNVDNVRVVKVLGKSVLDSYVVNGMVVKGDVEGTVKHLSGAKVAIYGQQFDLSSTETKGTVLFEKASEMLDFAKGEEAAMESVVKALHEAGIKCVVSGGTIGSLALHYLDKYEMMAVRLMSKFEVARLCRALHAIPELKLVVPSPEKIGFADRISVEEIGEGKMTLFERSDEMGSIATIVVRGSTQSIVDDVERALDDGINSVKVLTRDPRYVAGAGAAEIEIARQLHESAEAVQGLDQYSMLRFAEALEVVPRTISENAGLDSMAQISSLYAHHQKGGKTFGVGIEKKEGCQEGIVDALEAGILDLYLAKANAMRLAVKVACQVLQVDQIIMSRASGGPNLPQQGPRDG